MNSLFHQRTVSLEKQIWRKVVAYLLLGCWISFLLPSTFFLVFMLRHLFFSYFLLRKVFFPIRCCVCIFIVDKSYLKVELYRLLMLATTWKLWSTNYSMSPQPRHVIHGGYMVHFTKHEQLAIINFCSRSEIFFGYSNSLHLLKLMIWVQLDLFLHPLVSVEKIRTMD